jgi:hypothetical protein
VTRAVNFRGAMLAPPPNIAAAATEIGNIKECDSLIKKFSARFFDPSCSMGLMAPIRSATTLER